MFVMRCNALVPTEALLETHQVSHISPGSVTLFVRQKTFGPFIPVTYHSARSKYLRRRSPPCFPVPPGSIHSTIREDKRPRSSSCHQPGRPLDHVAGSSEEIWTNRRLHFLSFWRECEIVAG